MFHTAPLPTTKPKSKTALIIKHTNDSVIAFWGNKNPTTLNTDIDFNGVQETEMFNVKKEGILNGKYI